MKGIIWGIIGCAVAVGATMLILSKLLKKPSEAQSADSSNNKDYANNDVQNTAEAVAEFKSEVLQTMKERHKATANIIRESVENINDDTPSQSEHEDEFNDMFNDLDNLMSEE